MAPLRLDHRDHLDHHPDGEDPEMNSRRSDSVQGLGKFSKACLPPWNKEIEFDVDFDWFLPAGEGPILQMLI